MYAKQRYSTKHKMPKCEDTKLNDDSYKVSVLGKLINPYEHIIRDIPKGYNTKHYHPGEFPIILMGSIFDTYYLGKWMYDWAVYFWGAENEDTNNVEDMWLILIRWTATLKRLTILQEYVLPKYYHIELALHRGYGSSLEDELKSLIYLLGLSCQLTSNTESGSSNLESVEQLLHTIFRSIDQGRLTTKLLSRMSSWTTDCDITCMECEEFIRRRGM